MESKCVVPGLLAAIEREQTLRDLIYLDVPYLLCGLKVRNITPHLLAILKSTRTPFLFGGDITVEHIEQFLCVLAAPNEGETGEQLKARIMEHCAALDLQACANEVFEFLDVTYLDASTGKQETPIASGIAWLEYRMACEPFRWSAEKTMHTPLRRIYQLIRCWQKDQGEPVLNKSARIESDWLDEINKAMAEGRITEKDLAELNERSRAGGRN